MTPCSKYHMVFLIKSSKRIRNFVDVTNMHTLFKHLDDEMVTFISFCPCRYQVNLIDAGHGLLVHSALKFMVSRVNRKSGLG